MRQLIAGNWKMHGLSAQLAEIEAIGAARPTNCDILICPPATLIARAVERAKGLVPIGAQDCHAEASGAFTGDVSAEMLVDAGAVAVIVGHSERRQFHAESDAAVAQKARAAWRAGLLTIVCVGETQAERDDGRMLEVVARQIAASLPDGATVQNTTIAYEPVWAIGTGRTPTAAQIAEMHGHIRKLLIDRFATGRTMRILYGGSVKPSNANEILGIADVDGALVGGASLKAADFLAIAAAAAPP
ncbi:MAG: triose-phosphate isomerase [Alphaproteobacteria bacterium]|nr:triose-phosphate isomerase [Alphaproteobacteria bacterium]MBV9694011.1 triose-phosphate isomerase [Alphaproteobacteria bacterium]